MKEGNVEVKMTCVCSSWECYSLTASAHESRLIASREPMWSSGLWGPEKVLYGPVGTHAGIWESELRSHFCQIGQNDWIDFLGLYCRKKDQLYVVEQSHIICGALSAVYPDAVQRLSLLFRSCEDSVVSRVCWEADEPSAFWVTPTLCRLL